MIAEEGKVCFSFLLMYTATRICMYHSAQPSIVTLGWCAVDSSDQSSDQS